MAHRDFRIEQFKDFSRSIDYLEMRNDVDSKKIGFYGLSWGGGMGAHFPALEERIKLNILVHGGLRMEPALPEVDQINFVTRVKVPTLMLSGIYDFDFRPETSQIPMFNLLGTPAADKKRDHLRGWTPIPSGAIPEGRSPPGWINILGQLSQPKKQNAKKHLTTL